MSDTSSRLGPLWFGVAAPPAAWFLHLLASYILVGPACRSGATWALHLTTAATLAVAGTGLRVAWREWRRLAEDDFPGWARFLALAGIGLGVGFTFTIALAGIPPFVLGPCTP